MSRYDHLLRSRGVRAGALLTAGGVLAGSAVVGLLPTVAGASSHREAPLIAADPAVDNTDVYAFSSPENPEDVVLIANWIPFEEPNGGPNFYPWSDDAEYLINIDNDGDAIADLIYRWRFTTDDSRAGDTFLYNNGPVDSLDDENLLFRQTYTLDVSTDGGLTYPTTLLSDAPVAPSYTGPGSMGSSQDYVDNLRTPAETDIPGGGMTLATQAEDSFFLDLRVFDLLYGGDLSETGQDTLAGYNVNSIVLELPKDAVAVDEDAENNPVIGVWSTTTRPTLRNADGSAADDTSYTQVSRLGMPLVNEVVVPANLKDAFNSISPDMDAGIQPVVDRVLDPEVPKLIEGIYGIPAPAGPRYDIAEVFLTGIVTNDVVDVDGDPATDNPIDVDLNSQALNAGADPAAFQPSEMLRLNMAITGPTGLDGQPLAQASRLGVVGGDIQGFPNGRRLADDVLDIELLALEGVYDVTDFPNNVPQDRVDAGVAALAGGDGVDSNDNAFSPEFPYLSGPNTEAVNRGGGTGAGGTDTSAGNGTPGTPGQPASPSTAPVAAAPGQYPVGGVETGSGGWDNTLLPALTGGAALLLLGAGAGSLVRGRALRRQTAGGSPEV